MKKVKAAFRLICVCVLTSALALLSACAEKNYTLDEEKLANSLLENIEFECTMYQVDEASVSDFIKLENCEKQILYMGNGAYADSIGIFSMTDKAAAEAAMAELGEYLDDLEASFRDYLPKEAAEIEAAATVQKGKYVVFCISPNTEKALGIIDKCILEADSQERTGPKREDDVSGENKKMDSEELLSNKAVGEYPSVKANGKLKSYGNVVRIGDTGFELYSYSERGAEKYTSAVNRAAEALRGSCNVYEVLIPLSSGVTLPDEYFGKISSGNQRNSLDKIIKKASADVKLVDMYDKLMSHRDEYIYFRTDHHWTSLGAYYGYERFCEEKGVIPITTERRSSDDFGDFLGSFYTDTKNSKKMEKNPDSLKVYYPISEKLSLRYTAKDGSRVNWDVIHDVSDYPVSMKYSSFIAGDNPYTRIKNDSLPDGQTCIVVKESFGNAFVPYLTDHYSKIYVIDYRYWEGDVVKLAKEKKADDLIFVNNLSMIRSDYLTGRLSQIVGSQK